MTIEEIEEHYCNRCVYKEHCYKPCPQVISRQFEDFFEKRGRKNDNDQ